MAIVISRSAPAGTLTGSTSFVSLNQIAGSTVSSSFTVPAGVTAIKHISISQSADGAGEEFTGLIQISGNSMRDGSAVFAAGGQMTMGTSTGSNMNFVQYDTDLAVTSGNSCEFSIATTTNAAIDVVVTAQFA